MVYGLLLWLEHLDGLAEVIVVWVMFGVVVFVNVFDFTVLLILKSAECRKKEGKPSTFSSVHVWNTEKTRKQNQKRGVISTSGGSIASV